MLTKSSWITTDIKDSCPEFVKRIKIEKAVKSARLTISAIGIYEARINGNRVGDFIFAPGCTAYEKRLQYQQYDITDMLCAENELCVIVGDGWHRGEISVKCEDINKMPCAIIARIDIEYEDNTAEIILTDDSWRVRKTAIVSSDIYEGEVYDANFDDKTEYAVAAADLSKDRLIPHEGEFVREHERIKPIKMIITPKGERVIDFGQNMAGYIEISVDAKKGDKIVLSCGEVLDSDGNFYNENYRGIKSEINYVCKDGAQTYKPHFTFMGFRYIKLAECPDYVCADNFTAIMLYSDMKRTGKIRCGDARVNKLFENTLRSQKANFIDIPTDCPQRNERMGWTGDAQVFAKTAAYNFDVERFFAKWLGDVRVQQKENGAVPDTVPNFWRLNGASTAWGDVITVAPWTMYMMYGDKRILEDNFDAMRAWVDYMTGDTLDEFLWTCSDEHKGLWKKHYGDWLGLDSADGSYKGATDDDLIASAFYAYSTLLVVKAGKVIGEDVTEYEQLYENIVKTFKSRFNSFTTQTGCVLALYFDLTDNKEAVAKQLADMIIENGTRLQTGFVGTPYLLHALSDNGYTDLAYQLLMQNKYPSWLYEVEHGATSIWEHWDGIREDGTFWSADMNSYNHYAYGSVIDWVYSVAGGIKPVEDNAGFAAVKIAPRANKALGWLEVSLDTRLGKVFSAWYCENDCIRYEITTPVDSVAVIGGKEHYLKKGSYVFFEE